MKETVTTFIVVAVLTALLAAFSFLVQDKGYPQGALGYGRLDALASAATFIPLAALYAFAALLIMLAPASGAGFIYANGTNPIYYATVVLLASIIGLQVARVVFVSVGALRVLLDWQFVFAAGILVAHQFLDAFRRNVLLRTIGVVVFAAAVILCLFWTFRL